MIDITTHVVYVRYNSSSRDTHILFFIEISIRWSPTMTVRYNKSTITIVSINNITHKVEYRIR
jgi:hypothetical protein